MRQAHVPGVVNDFSIENHYQDGIAVTHFDFFTHVASQNVGKIAILRKQFVSGALETPYSPEPSRHSALMGMAVRLSPKGNSSEPE